MKLTEQVAQSLVNLRASPDFTRFLEWLSDYRDQYRDECCTNLELPKINRSQGKVKAVNEILTAVGEAPKVLEKFKSQL